MELEDALDDRKTEAGSAGFVRALFLDPVKPLKNMGKVFRRDPLARILDADMNLFTFLSQGKDEVSSLGGVLESVSDQILENTLDHTDVGTNERQARSEIPLYPDFLLVRAKLKFLDHVQNKLFKGKCFGMRGGIPGIQFCQFKQFLDEFG